MGTEVLEKSRTILYRWRFLERPMLFRFAVSDQPITRKVQASDDATATNL
jgi:hypothetical protein